MTQPSTLQSDLLRTALALLWHASPDGPTIAVVRCRWHPDCDCWTLPERLLPAREIGEVTASVIEVTGDKARRQALILAIFSSDGSIVRIWHTLVSESTSQLADAAPEEHIEWLSGPEACGRLRHSLDRILVAYWLSTKNLQRGKKKFQLWHHDSYKRLANDIPPYKVHLENLVRRWENQCTGSDHDNSWTQSARRALAEAEQALRYNKPELGWRCFNTAARMELDGWYQLDRDDGFRKKMLAILQEATEKLADSSWRRKTIVGALGGTDAAGGLRQNISVYTAMYAAQVLHEHHDNFYHRLNLLKRNLRVLNIVALVAIGCCIWLGLPSSLPAKPDTAQSWDTLLGSRNISGLVVLLGVMGAVVSGFSTLQGTSKARIPEQLQTAAFLIARLVMGVVSALVLSTFVRLDILNWATSSVQFALAAAFAAGFSERLVPKAVAAVVDKAEKK